MEDSPRKIYSFKNIEKGISESYNTHILGPINNIGIGIGNSNHDIENLTEFSNTQNVDLDSPKKGVFNILNLFNNPIAKKILSIFIIILLALILMKVSINNEPLSNSTTYFLNQCMWVWAIMLLIIIIINFFGFIK